MFGYLDAGSGSMIVGAVAAGAAGVGVAVRAGLSKFKRKPKDDGTETDTEHSDTEDVVEDADENLSA